MRIKKEPLHIAGGMPISAATMEIRMELFQTKPKNRTTI
jgi:hypothetical protein